MKPLWYDDTIPLADCYQVYLKYLCCDHSYSDDSQAFNVKDEEHVFNTKGWKPVDSGRGFIISVATGVCLEATSHSLNILFQLI